MQPVSYSRVTAKMTSCYWYEFSLHAVITEAAQHSFQ